MATDVTIDAETRQRLALRENFRGRASSDLKFKNAGVAALRRIRALGPVPALEAPAASGIVVETNKTRELIHTWLLEKCVGWPPGGAAHRHGCHQHPPLPPVRRAAA